MPNSCPRDHRTTALGTSIRCLIWQRDGQTRGFSPGRIGRSPERRQPDRERFQTVPVPLNGPTGVGDNTLHREAAEETNRDGHRGLAGKEYCRRGDDQTARRRLSLLV